MTVAELRGQYVDNLGRQVSRWNLNPILAIGGDRHGLTLPASLSPRLHVPVMPDLTSFVAEPDPVATMPQEQAYDRLDFSHSVPGRPWEVAQFPVYVASGMDRAEAATWVQLAVVLVRWLLMTSPLRPLVRLQQARREWLLEMRLADGAFFERVELRHKRRAWAAGRIQAYVWWCGDDHCDCVMPVIERVAPNQKAGYPWVRRERLWEGTFVSRSWGYPDGLDHDGLLAELREACEERGIPVPEEPE